jgi:hypothetical protein
MRLPILALLLFAAAMALTDVSIYKQLRKLGHRWLTTAHIAVSAIIYIVLAVIAAFAKSQAGEEFFIMMMWGLFSAISVSAAKLIYMPFYAISMIPRLRQSRTDIPQGAFIDSRNNTKLMHQFFILFFI